MIFINKGKDHRDHEILTCDEAQLRYPELATDKPAPYFAMGRRLRTLREKARVTIREMSRRSESLRHEIGSPLTFTEICDMEAGRVTLADVDMEMLWTKLITSGKPA